MQLWNAFSADWSMPPPNRPPFGASDAHAWSACRRLGDIDGRSLGRPVGGPP
jgi:hypothetical protein